MPCCQYSPVSPWWAPDSWWCSCRRQEAYFGRVATKLQALRRGVVQARLYRRMRASAVSIQAGWRCVTARRAFLRHRAAAVSIQARWRGLVALRAYHAARVRRSAPSLCVLETAWHTGWRQQQLSPCIRPCSQNGLIHPCSDSTFPYGRPMSLSQRIPWSQGMINPGHGVGSTCLDSTPLPVCSMQGRRLRLAVWCRGRQLQWSCRQHGVPTGLVLRSVVSTKQPLLCRCLPSHTSILTSQAEHGAHRCRGA